jgi:hypothetical protein
MATVQGRPGRKPSIVQLAWAGLDKAERKEKKAAKKEAAPPAPAPTKQASRGARARKAAK